MKLAHFSMYCVCWYFECMKAKEKGINIRTLEMTCCYSYDLIVSVVSLKLHSYCTIGWLKCHSLGGSRVTFIHVASSGKADLCCNLSFPGAVTGVFGLPSSWCIYRAELDFCGGEGRVWPLQDLPCGSTAVLCSFCCLVSLPASSQALGKGLDKGVWHLESEESAGRLLVSLNDFCMLMCSIGTVWAPLKTRSYREHKEDVQMWPLEFCLFLCDNWCQVEKYCRQTRCRLFRHK